MLWQMLLKLLIHDWNGRIIAYEVLETHLFEVTVDTERSYEYILGVVQNILTKGEVGDLDLTNADPPIEPYETKQIITYDSIVQEADAPC